jgi:hypothetical protein
VTVRRRGEDAQRPWPTDEHIGGGAFASTVLAGEIPLAEIYAGLKL